MPQPGNARWRLSTTGFPGRHHGLCLEKSVARRKSSKAWREAPMGRLQRRDIHRWNHEASRSDAYVIQRRAPFADLRFLNCSRLDGLNRAVPYPRPFARAPCIRPCGPVAAKHSSHESSAHPQICIAAYPRFVTLLDGTITYSKSLKGSIAFLFLLFGLFRSSSF